MKKIYMILAALSLLSLSLNAQVETVDHSNRQVHNALNGKGFKPNNFSFYDVLRSIDGMSSVLPQLNPNKSTDASGQFRAPLKINSGELTIGPFEGDNFSQTGLGFGNAYDQQQQVLIATNLLRDEIVDYNGYQIVGFRFALASQASTNNKARIYDFISWPASENGYFESANQHTWHLSDLSGGGSSSSSSNSVTIGNGSRTNSNLPVCGYYHDMGYQNQMIYTASQLNLSSGTEITSLTFYPEEGYGITFGGGTVQVTLSNTTASSFSGTKIAASGQTVVATITPVEDETVTAWTFTFDTPLVYTGNNILVQVETSGGDTWAYSYFLGDNQSSYVSLYSRGTSAQSSTSGTNSAFLPKATFGHNGSSGGGIFGNDYVELDGGQWYEYYLDEPIDFVVNDSISQLFLGYRYEQFPSSNTTEMTYPIAYNPESQTHNHWALLTTGSSNVTTSDITITISNCFQVSFYQIVVIDNETGNPVTSWTSSGSTGTYNGNTYYVMPTGWSLNGATYMYQETVSDTNLGYLSVNGQASIVISNSALNGCKNVTVQVVAVGWDENEGQTITVNGSNATTVEYQSLKAYTWNNIFNAPTTSWNQLSTFSTSYGDLAVQLILMKKTPAPTITYTQDNQYGHVTATATDPNATVTLTVGGQTVTGVGSVTINIGRGDQDVVVNATATAQEDGKPVSDPATGTFTVQASTLTPTPNPVITPQTLDATVKVTGTGEGEVHMYIDGQEVTNPYYLERGTEQYTVTVTVTAMINDGDHSMSTTTQEVVVPPLENLEQILQGWTELPGTYNDDRVINWANYLMFIDRFKVSTADNDHPAKYTYVMTENDTKLTRPLRKTSEHIIPVQLTRSKVHGFFTEQEVTDDRDRQHVTPFVMNADAEMYLEQSPDIYYYTLDRSRNSIADANFLELSRLQGDGNRYVEMNDNFTLHEPFNFNEPVQRYDTINTMLPAGATQGNKGMHFGSYDNQDYISYVPIIWTFGNMPTNKRANWDNDGIHNSYGSPIWKTGVGKVTMPQPNVEKQVDPKWGTTSWTEGTTKCNLYMITDLVADGYLPSREVSNIKYEPYMFRVFVESSNGKLRGYDWVPNEENEGQHCVSTNEGALNGPICIWEEKFENSTNISFDEATGIATFHKVKEDRPSTDVVWTIPEEMNIMFGAVDEIQQGDITIYVRFYYKSTGKSINEKQPAAPTLRADGDEEPAGNEVPSFYAAEGEQDPDNQHIFTSINGVFTGSHGEIVGVTYVNAQGMQSDKPFDGLNIVITRYSDGTTTNTKVIR